MVESILGFIVLVIIVVFIIIYNRNKKIVLEKSQRIKNLLELNKRFEFITLKPSYYNHMTCNTKRQFDRVDINDYLLSLIDSNEAFYRYLIESIEFNRESYDVYVAKTQAIESTATEDYCRSFGFTLNNFLLYEERLFKNRLLKRPQQTVEVYCIVTYKSPGGRNTYRNEKCYLYHDIKNYFDYTMELKEARQTRQYQIKMERAKMTDSLRWDILKRDNYMCQVCGSTVQDGVKLHVDHIIPVSKGGLTVKSNLRTLCDRCNLGKSDKM